MFYKLYLYYQFEGIFMGSIFFGVIANIDLILLLTLLPAVLFAFVGVFVILFLIGVRFYNFNAFYERSFFNFIVLLAFVIYKP
jgi:hypothetical protein